MVVRSPNERLAILYHGFSRFSTISPDGQEGHTAALTLAGHISPSTRQMPATGQIQGTAKGLGAEGHMPCGSRRMGLAWRTTRPGRKDSGAGTRPKPMAIRIIHAGNDPCVRL